jgi:hypothetical protein
MTKQISTRFSKSDFRLFREAPRHLWAKKNSRLDVSSANQLAGIQGEQVERLAKDYVETFILPNQPGCTFLWQETGTDDSYLARADALVREPGKKAADLYEIKSSTEVKKEDVEDAAFQTLIFQKQYHIGHIYLMLVNNDYIMHGPLDLSQLLKVEDITDQVNAILADIETLRAQALKAAQCADPEELEHCWKPKECVCLEVCHPGLPDFSIYDIPRLSEEKKRLLEGMGVRAAKEIPASFELSDSQRAIAYLARLGAPVMDAPRIREELGRIAYPVYFLDYETCNLAVPLFEGYKPYQQMVFQYSLHRLDGPEAELKHFEHLSTSDDDPAMPLLASLKKNLGGEGTVIVWNASFEKTRNTEMALLHPEYAGFLKDVNDRVHDLMEMVSKGLYLHPGFKGSSSIKHVLPVMVPELSYAEMEINEGAKASLAWWNIMFVSLDETEKKIIANQLLAYCKLDTLAMVEIFRRFSRI